MTEEPKRTFLPQGMAAQWKDELAALQEQDKTIGLTIKHLEMKIMLAERIEDAYGELIKAMQAKPGDPDYLPVHYQF